jgi:thiol-disulfide isomerase/thioredoxin
MRCAFIVVWLLCSANSFAADVPPSLPRYDLPVGRRLVYASESHFQNVRGSNETKSTVELVVVAHNADGSARIIVSSQQDEKISTTQPASSQTTQQSDVSQVDLMPDGRIISSDSDNSGRQLFLPPLPTDQAALAGSWRDEPGSPGETQTFISAGATQDGLWIFTNSSDGIYKRIYGINSDSTFHFDVAKGALVSMETRIGQTYGYGRGGVYQIRLQSNEMVPPAQFASLAKDMDTFLTARKQLWKTIFSISDKPDNATQIAAAAKAAFSAATSGVVTPQVKSKVDSERDSVDNQVKYEVEQAHQLAEVLNKPTYEFSADDLEGHSHKLSDYRGKIVVLDFWYRGCGWCMVAMPQMKQIVDDFKDKPVVVLGMNTDNGVSNARFVVDAMQLSYPTLKSSFEMARKFNVQGYPSLLIIDGAGVVREFHVGYSTTLRTDIDAKIQSLLDKKL